MSCEPLELDLELEPIECLDHGDTCGGKVEYRVPLSGTGRSYPRCDYHWAVRLEEQERIDEAYGSTTPPAWFDPTYAGEVWSEEDY